MLDFGRWLAAQGQPRDERDDIWTTDGGRTWLTTCCCCEKTVELAVDPSEHPEGDRYYCGGSPHCLP